MADVNVDILPEVFKALYEGGVETYVVYSPIFEVPGILAGAPTDDPVAKKAEIQRFATVEDLVRCAQEHAKNVWLYKATRNDSPCEAVVREGVTVRWWVRTQTRS